MTLYENLTQDRNDARKAGQADRRNILGYLLAETKALAKRSHPTRDPSDDEVIQTIRALIKKNDEVLVLRDDPIVREESRILLSYLPSQMEEAELINIINVLIPQLGEKSPKLMGAIMSKLRTEHTGEYDPAMASRVAKALLG